MKNLTAPAAVVAALALITEGAVIVVGGQVPDDHWGTQGTVVDLAFVVAALALAVASQSLPALLGLRRAGRAAVVASQLGFLAMAVESVASGIHGGNVLGGLFFGGLLLALAGSLVLGVDGMLSGRLRWAALLPVLGMLVGIAAGDQGGSIVWGLAWLALASAMVKVDQPDAAPVAV